MFKRLSLNKRILLAVLGFSAISQMVFLYLNVTVFTDGYQREVRSSLETIGSSLQARLNKVLGKGVSINSLVGLEPLLRRALAQVDTLSKITVVTPDDHSLYSCNRTSFTDHPVQHIARISQDALRFPLTDGSVEVIGQLVLEPDRQIIARRIKDIILDSTTIILISILTIVDLLFFMVAYIVSLPVANAARDIEFAVENQVVDHPVSRTGIDFIDHLLDLFDSARFAFKDRWIKLQAIGSCCVAGDADRNTAWKKLQTSLAQLSTISSQQSVAHPVLSPVLIRPVIFLSVFAEALAISFLPLYAHQLYHPLFGLPQEVVIGLPIAVYMFCFALSLPIGGAWSDLFGRHRIYLAGAVITAAGLGLCGLAQGIISLILARGMVGIGNGAVFMAAQGYILDTTSAENRAEGLAIHLSAFYSGTMCATALGSMLADRIGYRALFFLGSIMALLAVVFLYLFIAEPRQAVSPTEPSDRTLGKRMKEALPSLQHIKLLLANRNFAATALLQAMPNKICLIGLVFFAAPIMLKAEGVSQSDIGRIVAIYSLLMVLFSQLVSRWSDRFDSTKQLIFWGGLISGMAFVPFFFTGDTWVVIGAITILGLVHTLTVSNQAKLASRLKSVQQVGLGPGLGIYRQMERLGNVLATLVIGALAAAIGFSRALGIVGLSLIVMSLLFAWLFQEEKEI